MKSYISLLPFVGFVLAQDQCGPRLTVTEVEVEKVTVTVQPTEYIASSPAIITPTTNGEAKPTYVPQAPYYPIGNGTYNQTSRFPTHAPPSSTTLESFVFPTSTKSAKIIYVSPSPVGSRSAAPAAAVQMRDTASDATASAVDVVKGKAKFYGGNVDGGHCSFSGYQIPSGLFGTAFGGNWDASQCGACVSVIGPTGKSIKAMIVDQCPECDRTLLDLFENGFTQIGSKSTGVIDISYSFVPCGITSPIILKNKSGTSPYWFSMQVVNSNVAISKLEVSIDGGATWKATSRQPYNFFENSSGFGKSSVDVKVTSVDGKSIVVKGVSVSSGSTKTASSNFS